MGKDLYPQVYTPTQFVLAIRASCTHYTGVPCSDLSAVIDLLPGYVPAARENHAVAWAFGVRVGGGRPVVLMQNSGLGTCIDTLYGLHHLYGVGLLMVVTARGELAWEEVQHQRWGRMTGRVLRAAGVRYFDLDQRDNLVAVAANLAYDKGVPVAVVIHRGNIR